MGMPWRSQSYNVVPCNRLNARYPAFPHVEALGEGGMMANPAAYLRLLLQAWALGAVNLHHH